MKMEKRIIEQNMKLATEAISNIRTVAGLRQERHVIGKFVDEMYKTEALIRKQLTWRGTVNSSSVGLTHISYSLTMCYGGILLANRTTTFEEIIKYIIYHIATCAFFVNFLSIFTEYLNL